MNYAKIAAMGIRFFALYYILDAVYDVIYILGKLQTNPHFDPRSYIVGICSYVVVALSLNHFSLPLGRKLAKNLEEPKDPAA